MSRSWLLVSTILIALAIGPAAAAKKADSDDVAPKDEGPFTASIFAGLQFRSIGPALTSGRITDFAVHPEDRKQYYVAIASGGVWKTVNAGTTWTPLFDDQDSYSIGCVTLDPNNPLTVWVGTGENNSQRSVSYGDGVYRSDDGGKTWTNVGLERSEHIGEILVDPRDSDVVWVAAQGPLWSAGGDRGLYKTVDGGASWKLSLDLGPDTGVTDIAFDPRDPDTIYAAAYQRRRRVWTLIDGGPESGLYKSTDGGANWTALERGLPKEDLGRIGIAVSPANPDVVYAIVESERGKGGFFRSVDAGSNFEKRSDYVSGSPQYYQEIVADPKDVDRVYSLDTFLMVTTDGGKKFSRVPNRSRHIDDHALWIDPTDTGHLLVGSDGGIYESWDRAAHWQFKANLPVTQFYRIAVDNAQPFYNVYGGTQDNFTLGGPSRTTSSNGISNRDWFITLGGDGFEPQVDPENPDIVYSQSQYGELARVDRRNGETINIQPQPAPGEDPLRWNWNSALIISPHSNTRLYFAAQRVFRSDDRGNSWGPISPDLSRGLDRNQIETMGRIQKADAVAKGVSTSFYGNVVSLSESPVVENLLYAGTDDGLIQIHSGADAEWQRIDVFPDVPERSYVADIEASRHAADTVFAAFDNHKSGDFAPYLLRSDDRGQSWVSIIGDLPERGTVHTLVQDHRQPDLLFAGTEFGVWVTVDGGGKWTRLKGGLPTIAVRDLEIQRREDDLVVGTFGRGIYILDDYSPLREVSESLLEDGTKLFPVKRAWMFMPSTPLGLPGKAFQGDSFFTVENPPAGAVFTYYLADGLETRREKRHAAEAKADEAEDAEDAPASYPSWEDLRNEDREEAPTARLTVTDEDGHVVRRLEAPIEAGFHRIAWDLRYPPSEPTKLADGSDFSFFEDPPRGPMVVPGTYRVELATRVDGQWNPYPETRTFETVPLGTATLPAVDRDAVLAFQKKVARLQRAVLGSVRAAAEAGVRIDHIKRALVDTPEAPARLGETARELEIRLTELQEALSGDPVRRRYAMPTPPSIVSRVQRIVGSQWTSTSAPTRTNLDSYRHAGEAFVEVLADLRELTESDLARLEDELESTGGPWTPGRVPTWTPE